MEYAEQLVQELHDRISLTPEYRKTLESALRKGLREVHQDTEDERNQLRLSLEKIARRQEKLLEAHFNDAIPVELLKTKQAELHKEQTQAESRLKSLEADVEEADEIIAVALDLARTVARPTATRPSISSVSSIKPSSPRSWSTKLTSLATLNWRASWSRRSMCSSAATPAKQWQKFRRLRRRTTECPKAKTKRRPLGIGALTQLYRRYSKALLSRISVLWCPRQDSNLRPSAPEADALSPELRRRGSRDGTRPQYTVAPGGTESTRRDRGGGRIPAASREASDWGGPAPEP